MDQSDIRDAILLFESSQTGRSGPWPARVTRCLWDLYRRNEVGFQTPKNKDHLGAWKKGRQGFDLRVNPEYIKKLPEKSRLPAVSLILVHEGVHATIDREELEIEEELAGRTLAIHYFRELSGPGVFNEANDPAQPGKQWGIIWIASKDSVPDQEESELLAKDQLLDKILADDTYTGDNWITAEWILANLQGWGGIKNRWASTKGLYIRILTAETSKSRYTPAVASVLLDIMESVTTAKEWKLMLGRAGPLNRMRTALEANLDKRSSARISQLVGRWKTQLMEDPTSR